MMLSTVEFLLDMLEIYGLAGNIVTLYIGLFNKAQNRNIYICGNFVEPCMAKRNCVPAYKQSDQHVKHLEMTNRVLGIMQVMRWP
jgi:hypothetical protein